MSPTSETTRACPARQLFVCVFSKDQEYYLGCEDKDETFEMNKLNENMVPSGTPFFLGKDELLAEYVPEPGMYMKSVRPRMREIVKAVAWGDKYREQKNFYSAEVEYQKALALDEDHVRAVFGLGLSFLGRGENDKATEVLQKVISLEEAFAPKHKHLLNEFGIALRKQKLYPEAIAFYERALELAEKDGNLHFNLARAAAHQGLTDLAFSHIDQCLKLEPRLKKAKELKAFLQQQSMVESGTKNVTAS